MDATRVGSQGEDCNRGSRRFGRAVGRVLDVSQRADADAVLR